MSETIDWEHRIKVYIKSYSFNQLFILYSENIPETCYEKYLQRCCLYSGKIEDEYALKQKKLYTHIIDHTDKKCSGNCYVCTWVKKVHHKFNLEILKNDEKIIIQSIILNYHHLMS